jgi:xanthine permease
MMPQLFERLPQTLQLFTSNGIVMSSLTAVVLNLILNGVKNKE